jgi:hypothetical protein
MNGATTLLMLLLATAPATTPRIVSDAGHLNPDWFNALKAALDCHAAPQFVVGMVLTNAAGDALLRCAREKGTR